MRRRDADGRVTAAWFWVRLTARRCSTAATCSAVCLPAEKRTAGGRAIDRYHGGPRDVTNHNAGTVRK